MKKDPGIYLEHILEAINKISRYVEGMSEDDFLKDELVRDAVVRNIEIVGEAVKNLPADYRDKHDAVPWKDIAGMRDRIAHFYFGIDYGLVWLTVRKDLPELERTVRRLLKELK